MEYDVAPVPIDELKKQGIFICLYGQTGTGKSTLFASLPLFSEDHVDEWKDDFPNAAEMMESGFFPDLSGPGSIGVIDMDKKWGAYLTKGDWVRRGYTRFLDAGIYKIYQPVFPERFFKVKKGGGAEITGQEDLDFAKNYFISIFNAIVADPSIKVIIIDPISIYKDFCMERFLAIANKVMPFLAKNPVDPTDGARQNMWYIQNKEFAEILKKCRESGRWIFLSFSEQRKDPNYVKESNPEDAFTDRYTKVDWCKHTPEDVDQITHFYKRVSTDIDKPDKWFMKHIKGPFKPEPRQVEIPDTRYLAQFYMETIARSVMGK